MSKEKYIQVNSRCFVVRLPISPDVESCEQISRVELIKGAVWVRYKGRSTFNCIDPELPRGCIEYKGVGMADELKVKDIVNLFSHERINIQAAMDKMEKLNIGNDCFVIKAIFK